MLDDARQRGFRPRTLGGDRGYDTRQCVKDMRDRGVTPTRSSANSLGDRRENNPAFELRAEPEDSQVGGGDIRVDEDDGGIPTHSVSRLGAYWPGRVLCGYGLQPGADGEPVV